MTWGGLGEIHLLVAISREESAAGMFRVLAVLVILGVVGAAGFMLLLETAVRKGLAPLEKVGSKASRIDADTIGERFSEEELPAELVPIVEKLNDLLARLDMSFQRERRFSDDLAHEFRNPVAALRSIAEVALELPDDCPEENFRDGKAISEQLHFTIENMLTLARIEKKKHRIRREETDLHQVTEESWKLCQARAEERGIALSNGIPPGRTIQTDPSLFRVLISNLVLNAAEYSPAGSRITVVGTEGKRVFSISNPAPHLEKSDLAHLFDRLWRHDEARSDTSHCGLGLSLAQSCADALQLVLGVELDSGVVTFSVEEKVRSSSSPKKVS